MEVPCWVVGGARPVSVCHRTSMSMIVFAPRDHEHWTRFKAKKLFKKTFQRNWMVLDLWAQCVYLPPPVLCVGARVGACDVCLCRVCLCVSLCFDEAAGLSRELGAGPLMLPADAGVGAGGDAKCWLMGTYSQVLEGQGRRGLQHWRLGHRWLEDENGRCSQANPSSQLPFCSSRVALPRATLGSSGSPHAAAAAAAAADLRAVGQSNVIRRLDACEERGCMQGSHAVVPRRVSGVSHT